MQSGDLGKIWAYEKPTEVYALKFWSSSDHCVDFWSEKTRNPTLKTFFWVAPHMKASTKKRDFRAKSGGSGTFTWTLPDPRGVRSCKLDTYGIYINDLWKTFFFWKQYFFQWKILKRKNMFSEKSRNPQNPKILKSQNFGIFRKIFCRFKIFHQKK